MALALGELQERQKAANALAAANCAMLQVAHEVSYDQKYSSLVSARAADAEAVRAATQQPHLLMTATVSAARFEARSECQNEGHATMIVEYARGAATRARDSKDAAAAQNMELRRRDDEKSAGSAMSTHANFCRWPP